MQFVNIFKHNVTERVHTMQLATRIDEEQGNLFRQTTKALGTTPADALRMFIVAFNTNRGFPYDVRIPHDANWEPFHSEEEALDFTTANLKEAIDAAW